MLTRLCLSDFILIRDLEIFFSGGFSALTGETGAGKSVLVGALGLLGGGRAARGHIRPGATTAEIEATFDIAECETVRHFLAQNSLQGDGGELLVRRILSEDAKKSRAFINGRQTPLSQMATAVSLAVEICGQHGHYLLQKTATQRELVDAYAAADSLAAKTRDAFLYWQKTAADLQTATRGQAMRRAAAAALQNDIAELSLLNFSTQKWDAGNAKLKFLSRLSDVAEGCKICLQLLENENGAQNQLSEINKRLSALTRHDDSLRNAQMSAEESLAAAGELARMLNIYAAGLEPDAAAQESAEEFISESRRLTRKHNLPEVTGLEKMLGEKEKCLRRLNQTADVDALGKKESAAKKTLTHCCLLLTKKRKSGGEKFARQVSAKLRELAMPDAKLQVWLQPSPGPTANGAEKVVLQISTRKGVAAGGLSEVASGGELSRLGLAIHITAQAAAPRPVAVFDEVDAGIGGATAMVVGGMLQTLGRTRQVLAVTHLPQVAAFADHHFAVKAATMDGQRTMHIGKLDAAARVEEIARMGGGKKITEAARRHAAELLSQAEN